MACAGAILLLVGWMLTTYGITLVVTHSTIAAPLRKLLAPIPFFGFLVTCPMCFGWWVGGAVTVPLAIRLSPLAPHLLGFPLTTLDLLLITVSGAFASSAWCWLVHVLEANLRLGPELPPKITSAVKRRPYRTGPTYTRRAP